MVDICDEDLLTPEELLFQGWLIPRDEQQLQRPIIYIPDTGASQT